MILVVDDDQAFRDFMQECLTDEGYQVVAVPASDLALAWLRQEPASLLLTDLRLGGSTAGLDLIRAVRHDLGHATIPIIMLTADSRALSEFGPLLTELGCDVLAKPFNLDDMLTLVAARVQPGRS